MAITNNLLNIVPLNWPRSSGPTRIFRRPRPGDWGFVHASHNRHTGQPHEHKREIARRLRQATALASKEA